MSEFSESDIYATLTAILRSIFNDPTLVLSPQTAAGDVAGWNSFVQINIIVAVEEHFDVRFRAAEAQHIKNVGDLVRAVSMKLT